MKTKEKNMTMNQLALHIIALANKNNVSITNLQLQKVMYFSMQRAIRSNLLNNTTLSETYDEPFMVWRYGPVIKTIYEHFNIYGGGPIIDNGEESSMYAPLNSVISGLLRERPFDLVDRSHSERFWIEHSNQINGWRSNVTYGINDIIGEPENVE